MKLSENRTVTRVHGKAHYGPLSGREITLDVSLVWAYPQKHTYLHCVMDNDTFYFVFNFNQDPI